MVRLYLAIVAVLFFLFGAAYHMRIVLSNDWVVLPEPPLLWANTVVLVLTSIAFEWARSAAHRGREERMKTAFMVAGALTLVFLIGQIIVWNQQEVWIYTQDRPFEGDRIYAPRRNPEYNESNYRTTVSMPAWEAVRR